MARVPSRVAARGETPWRHAVALWFLVIACESMSGTVRELVLRPALGEAASKHVGLLVGSLLVLAIATFFAKWLQASTLRAQLQAGAAWVVLTVAFEAMLALWLGLSLDAFLADYDPTRGGWMGAGLAVLLLAPMLGVRLHAFAARRRARA